jgi:hypothetical protein
MKGKTNLLIVSRYIHLCNFDFSMHRYTKRKINREFFERVNMGFYALFIIVSEFINSC